MKRHSNLFLLLFSKNCHITTEYQCIKAAITTGCGTSCAPITRCHGFDAYFGRIRTLIPATSGQRFGIIRTA